MNENLATLYGVATVGTKGQVVIPSLAREQAGLKPGTKVIIMGKKHLVDGSGLICICPVASAQKFIDSMTSKLAETQAIIKESQHKKERFPALF